MGIDITVGDILIVAAQQGEASRVILCPFCREQEPTCVIRVEHGHFRCMACKKSGPVSLIPTAELPDGVRWELEDKHLI